MGEDCPLYVRGLSAYLTDVSFIANLTASLGVPLIFSILNEVVAGFGDYAMVHEERIYRVS